MIAKELCLLVIGLCSWKLATSEYGVKGPDGHPVTGNMRSFNESQVTSLHTLLKKKMELARDVIRHGRPSAGLPSMDPLRLGALSFVIQEPGVFVSISLRKMVVTGLSNLTVRDVASNNAAMRTSVLMNLPKVHISCGYRVKGYIEGDGISPARTLDDEGIFEADLERAAVSWYARVLNVDQEDLLVAQTGLRTHMDEATRQRFRSSRKGRLEEDGVAGVLGANIVDRVRQIIEDKMNVAISQVVSKAHDELHELLESTMGPHSQVPRTFSPHHHRLSKRQVPCNNGTELDDYVDYLFRFARRIIRAMEPIPGPNFTVYIEEHLQVFLYDVQASNVYTLSRRKPAYVVCHHDDVTVGLVIRVETITANAKYRVISDRTHLLYNGDADIKLSDTVIWAQITQLGNGNNRLDVFKIWRLGKMQVLLKGLGNLTSAMSMLLNNILNHDPWNVIPVAEAQAIAVGREMLANITVPIFSLV